jgi:hypothetical protein
VGAPGPASDLENRESSFGSIERRSSIRKSIVRGVATGGRRTARTAVGAGLKVRNVARYTMSKQFRRNFRDECRKWRAAVIDTFRSDHTLVSFVAPPEDDAALTEMQITQICFNGLSFDLLVNCVQYGGPESGEYEPVDFISSTIMNLQAAFSTLAVVLIFRALYRWSNSRKIKPRNPRKASKFRRLLTKKISRLSVRASRTLWPSSGSLRTLSRWLPGTSGRWLPGTATSGAAVGVSPPPSPPEPPIVKSRTSESPPAGGLISSRVPALRGATARASASNDTLLQITMEIDDPKAPAAVPPTVGNPPTTLECVCGGFQVAAESLPALNKRGSDCRLWPCRVTAGPETLGGPAKLRLSAGTDAEEVTNRASDQTCRATDLWHSQQEPNFNLTTPKAGQGDISTAMVPIVPGAANTAMRTAGAPKKMSLLDGVKQAKAASQFQKKVSISPLKAKRQQLQLRSRSSYLCRTAIAWLFSLFGYVVVTTYVLIYGASFGDAGARDMLMQWTKSFGMAVLLLEPVNVLMVATLPFLHLEETPFGRGWEKINNFYNDYFN